MGMVVPIQLKYFGAAVTGRWAGEGGRNYQNLPSAGSLERQHLPDIRSFLIARPGKVLLIADFSQIEARLLLWQVGDEKQLRLIREGQSPYEAHARVTMGWDKGELKQEDPALYALAKARVLSCGYGAGAEKFQGMAEAAGISMTAEEAKETVQAYRDSNPKVVEAWQSEQKRLQSAVGDNAQYIDVYFAAQRRLRYWFPRRRLETKTIVHEDGEEEKVTQTVIKGQLHRTQRYSAKRIYGPKLVQNLTQGNGRDVLAGALFRLYRYHSKLLSVLLHVHDEIVAEVDECRVEEAQEIMLSCMTEEMRFFEGLPLAAEIKIADRYTK